MTSSNRYYAICFLVLIQLTHILHGIEKSYHLESCLFIGCECAIDTIKCPASKSDLSFTMFPKRSLYMISSENISLDLSENRLKLLPDDRFAHLKFFKLNLSSNHIETISTYSFRDIGDLKILDLSNNRLCELRAEYLTYLKKMLQTIILERNFLYQMDQVYLGEALNKLSKLENLNLAFNDLKNLPDLTRLINLKILYFASNKIINLVDASTQDCLLPVSILELHLQYNNIKTLDKNAFHLLTNLKYLNLAFNQISQISETSFYYLTSLEELNLRNNYLKHIPSRIFYTLNCLDHLDLSSQKIRLEEIDDYAFNRQVNYTISTIDLSNNHINKIKSRAFCTTSFGFYVAVREINLQENNLRHIDPCNMQQLYNGNKENYKVLVKTSRASKNYTNHHHLLTCDCELSKAAKLVNIDGHCLDQKNNIRVANIFSCTDNWNKARRQACPKEFNCAINQEITTTKITTKFRIQRRTTAKINFLNETFKSNYSNFNLNDTYSVSGVVIPRLKYFSLLEICLSIVIFMFCY